MWSILLSFLMMRALPVKWWSVLIVAGILALTFKAEMLRTFERLYPRTTPTYRIERIEGGD